LSCFSFDFHAASCAESQVRTLRQRLEQMQKKATEAEATSAALERARAAAESERVKAVVERQRVEKEAQAALRLAELDKANAIAAASAAASRVAAAPISKATAGDGRRLSGSRSSAVVASYSLEDKENSPVPPAPSAASSAFAHSDIAAADLFAATKRRSSDRLRIKLGASEQLHSSKKQAWEDETSTSPKHVASNAAVVPAARGIPHLEYLHAHRFNPSSLTPPPQLLYCRNLQFHLLWVLLGRG
jgi:hypothetical protein